MTADTLPRRLTAILHADIAGYSRLTGESEEGAHRRLRTYLGAVAHLVAGRRGRVVH